MHEDFQAIESSNLGGRWAAGSRCSSKHQRWPIKFPERRFIDQGTCLSTLTISLKHLYLPNLFQKITFQTHLQLFTSHLHQPPPHTPPDPAWQVLLDDKFQGSRPANRLTTKDPSKFWPGWRMERQLGRLGGLTGLCWGDVKMRKVEVNCV